MRVLNAGPSAAWLAFQARWNPTTGGMLGASDDDAEEEEEDGGDS
jgi:hypothetical protein